MSLLTEEILKDVELKKLIDTEKTARLENELEKNRAICKQILSVVQNRNDFPNYLRLFEYLTQRRNQGRECIISMVKNSLNDVLPNLKNNKDSSDLLKTVIKVTEGKIFVEFEYSQAIRKMTEIYLMNKQINEAAKLVQDVQIETFGSLDNKYKVDYILFQMQVLLEKGDYIRTLIVSNKIKRNHLDDEGFELLKIRFFNLMIQYYFHEKKYIEVSKCYKALFDFVKKINEKLGELEKNNKEIKPEIIENYLTVKKENDLQKLFEN
jgi:26S proteasome regulatory subunit N5